MAGDGWRDSLGVALRSPYSVLTPYSLRVASQSRPRNEAVQNRLQSILSPYYGTVPGLTSATGRPTRRAIATNHWLGSGGGALGSGFLGSVASNVHTDRIRAGQLNRAATSLSIVAGCVETVDAVLSLPGSSLAPRSARSSMESAERWSTSRASDDGIPRCGHRKANLSATANPGESSTKR